MYINEIAPAKLRGLFGSLPQLFITIGILLVYALGTGLNYYWVANVAIGISLLLVVLGLFLQETPRWLVANNYQDTAEVVLRKLRGPNYDVDSEMSELQNSNDTTVTLNQKIRLLLKKRAFIPLLFSLGLMFFQQFSGVNVVMFYAGSVLENAGFPKSEATLIADFSVGTIQVFATIVAVLLVDLFGRKILLVVSSIVMAISTGALGFYFFFTNKYICVPQVLNSTVCQGQYGYHDFSYLAVVGMALFTIGFSIGWGPIPWLMMGELFPLKVRGILSGVATAVNWLFAFIITMAFGQYQEAVQPYGGWWSFTILTLIGIPFVIIFLPETKGKTLEQIEEDFRQRYGQ